MLTLLALILAVNASLKSFVKDALLKFKNEPNSTISNGFILLMMNDHFDHQAFSFGLTIMTLLNLHSENDDEDVMIYRDKIIESILKNAQLDNIYQKFDIAVDKAFGEEEDYSSVKNKFNEYIFENYNLSKSKNLPSSAYNDEFITILETLERIIDDPDSWEEGINDDSDNKGGNISVPSYGLITLIITSLLLN